MAVLRIVPNMSTDAPAESAAFYRDLLGLDTAMDMGWIVTLASGRKMAPQISLMSEGGTGAPVPDVSIEVEDVDDVHARAVAAGHDIVHGIVDEPWGVRRFFLRDPAGNLLNILAHVS